MNTINTFKATTLMLLTNEQDWTLLCIIDNYTEYIVLTQKYSALCFAEMKENISYK